MVAGQSTIEAMVQGLLLGLATGASCLGSCAPIMVPFLATREGPNARGSLAAIAQFCLGRFAGYAAIALLATAIAVPLGDFPVARRLLAVPLILLAALMVAYGLGLSFPEARLCSRLRDSAVLHRFPWLAGLLIGLAPCPPLLLCAAAAGASGSLAAGAVYLAGFMAGTTAFVLPLALGGLMGRVQSLRGAAEVAAIVAGLWFFSNGLAVLVS